MRKKLAKTPGFSILCLALLATGLWFWRQSVVEKRATWAAPAIAQRLEEGDFVAARSALTAIPDPVKRAAKEREINETELKDAVARRDGGGIRQAMTTGDFSAELAERADLVLAREALWNREWDECAGISERWSGKTKLPHLWTFLSADLLMARGKKDEARALLEAAQLAGADDALRHARLALLLVQEPWKAMEAIDAGLRATPRSAELLSFRAQIQEAAGRVADARLDYVAAVLSDAANPLHRDILANFQLRMGEPSHAADTWRDGADATQVGIFAFKAWFWSKICGVPLSQPLPEVTQPGWDKVMEKIKQLPSGAYTSDELDHAMAEIRDLRQRPEVRWMNVLEALRKAEWKVAIERLDWGFPRPAEEMAPGLATRLYVNLIAVSGGVPREGLAGRELPPLALEPHPFLREFDDWKKSGAGKDDAFSRWLSHPASLAATLFSHGWLGAALDVAGGKNLAPVPAAPAWFDFGYARCLIVRDGAGAARQWLESVPELSAAAQLTLGEILLTGGEAEAGIKKLAALAQGGGIHAGRASWTLALAELERGNTAAASGWVKGTAELLASVRGKEILARAALADGTPDAALLIYRQLGEESVDAMIYLSKEAFAKKDWLEARKWAGELARRFPAEPQFRKNLLRIDDAEAGKP